MEKTITPVGLIKTICGKLRDEKLENIAEVEEEIKLLGEYLGTGTMKTVIFSAIYDRCAGGSYSDIDDLARYFECSSLDIVAHKREIEEMLTRGLIELANDKMQFIRYQFKVSETVFDAIIDGKALGECKQVCRSLDQFEFVKTVGAWVENREDEHVSSAGLYAMVSDLEKKYSSCEFVCKVMELVPAIDDRILFYDTCKDRYFDDRNTDLDTTFKDIIDNQKELLQKMKTYIEESSELHKLDLVNTWKYVDEYKMKPSRQGYELFLGEYAECKMSRTRDLDKFEFVKMVYDFVQARTRENYSVRRLAGEVRNLEYDNSCLNIVRQARKLIQSSEDRAFFYYLCNEYLSGRTYLDSALQDIYDKQNMIMEQMEKQKGILIATTNLESSLDPAFERRFLFKVKFERPGVEAKKHIWMDKLHGLNEADAAFLAENYNLSGGEIDNVVRKVTMNRVLTGEGYSLDYLKELCSQEKFTKQNRVVGF